MMGLDWALNPMGVSLHKDIQKYREQDHAKRLGLCSHKTRNTWNKQKLEEARTDFHLETSEGTCP